ncbi:hypothetical protein C8Q80DRAFT_906903 [Daedaleopsis nitida]|nr:hypothetical protein C8Q80DRAFT_906903 [Daedaleopsis nitida]
MVFARCIHIRSSLVGVGLLLANVVRSSFVYYVVYHGWRSVACSAFAAHTRSQGLPILMGILHYTVRAWRYPLGVLVNSSVLLEDVPVESTTADPPSRTTILQLLVSRRELAAASAVPSPGLQGKPNMIQVYIELSIPSSSGTITHWCLVRAIDRGQHPRVTDEGTEPPNPPPVWERTQSDEANHNEIS